MNNCSIVYGLLCLSFGIKMMQAGYSFPMTKSEGYYLHRTLFDQVCWLHKRIILESNEGKNPEKVYTNNDFGAEYRRMYSQYCRDRSDLKEYIMPEDIDLLDQALLNLKNDLYGVTPIKPWLHEAWEKRGEKQ